MYTANPDLLLEVLEQSPDAFACYDADHRLQYCNGAFIAWFFPGWTQETLTGRPIQDIVEICYACGRIAACNGYADWRQERLRSHSAPGRPYDYLLVDGRVMQGREQALSNGGTLSVLTDITERVRLAEARADSEQRYRNLFENAAVGVYRSTREGSFLEVNPAMAAIQGCDGPADFLAHFHAGRHFYVDPETRGAFLAALDRDNVARDFEAEIYRKDGSQIWVSETARCVRDQQGNILGYEGFITDITARRQAEAERDLSEARFRDFAELSADWFWETDLEQRFTWQEGPNPILEGTAVARLEILGLTRWEVLARLGADPALAEVVAGYMARGESFWNLVFRFPHPITGETWVRFSGRPVYDAGGRIVAYRGVGSDISEEKRAEAARQRVDARLRQASQMAAVAHWVWDEESGRCIDCSENLTHFSGLSREEFIGTTNEEIQSYIHPEDQAEFRHAVANFYAGGDRFEIVFRVVTRAGQVRWCREIAERIPGPDGRLTYSIGTLQDITAERQLQSELREAKQQLQSQLDCSPLGIVILDREGQIQSWNPAAEAIFGWPAAEVIGKPSPLIPAAREHEREEMLGAVARGERIQDYYTVRQRKDGREIDISVNAAPLTGENAEIRGAVCLVADMTDRRQLEAELRKQGALAMHAQKLESVATLASGLAHDFNNMLLPIMIAAENITDGLPDDHACRRDAEQILHTAERVADLVRRLLDFSRAEKPERRLVSMHDAIAQALPLVEATLPAKLSLETELGEDGAEVEIDTGQLLQVLLNLVGNAADAQQQRGVIRLTLEIAELDPEHAARLGVAGAGRYAKLALSDEGSGIAEKDLPQIFDPFFTTKEVGQGTGLGLSVIHGIVTAHGGAIEVESAVGQGTTFDVYFPIRGKRSGQPPFQETENTAA